MKRLGAAMPFEPGGAPRVKIVDPGDATNLDVVVDGRTVHTFADVLALKRGWAGPLADGSMLEVALRRRYGSIFARLDVRRNDRALPGSAWDPARLVRIGAFLMLVLGTWPLFDLLQRRAINPFDLGIAVTLFVCAGLARQKKRSPAVAALGAGAALLLVRAALLLALGATLAPALCVLLATRLVRDARAARDLPG